MTAHSRSRTPTSDHASTGSTTPLDSSKAVDFESLLELLSDEYACELLRTLDDGHMAAGALVEQCGMSRPTVYRRLETMVEAGIIDARQASTADGRQRTEYRLVVDAVEFTLHPDGVSGAVRPDATER